MPFAYASARDPHLQPLLSTRRTPPGTLVAEGNWAHRCLLDTGADIDVLAWCPELADPVTKVLAEAAARQAQHAYEVSARTFARISRRHRPSGLASLVRLPTHAYAADGIGGRRVHSGTLVLVADGVEYASNLGMLIRVVDACGADALILTNRRARVDHPDVFVASRGTVLTTPVVEIPTVSQSIDWLTNAGFGVYLALPDATIDYRECAYAGSPTAIVVGSEGNGVDPLWRDHDHVPVSIPMRGRADSLNVAVAAGVLLFEAGAAR